MLKIVREICVQVRELFFRLLVGNLNQMLQSCFGNMPVNLFWCMCVIISENMFWPSHSLGSSTILQTSGSDHGGLIRESRQGKTWYKCTLCGKEGGHKNNMLKHYRSHTGEKPYTCSVCGKRFTQSSNLITHMKMSCGKWYMKNAAVNVTNAKDRQCDL